MKKKKPFTASIPYYVAMRKCDGFRNWLCFRRKGWAYSELARWRILGWDFYGYADPNYYEYSESDMVKLSRKL